MDLNGTVVEPPSSHRRSPSLASSLSKPLPKLKSLSSVRQRPTRPQQGRPVSFQAIRGHGPTSPTLSTAAEKASRILSKLSPFRRRGREHPDPSSSSMTPQSPCAADFDHIIMSDQTIHLSLTPVSAQDHVTVARARTVPSRPRAKPAELAIQRDLLADPPRIDTPDLALQWRQQRPLPPLSGPSPLPSPSPTKRAILPPLPRIETAPVPLSAPPSPSPSPSPSLSPSPSISPSPSSSLLYSLDPPHSPLSPPFYRHVAVQTDVTTDVDDDIDSTLERAIAQWLLGSDDSAD